MIPREEIEKFVKWYVKKKGKVKEMRCMDKFIAEFYKHFNNKYYDELKQMRIYNFQEYWRIMNRHEEEAKTIYKHWPG